MIKDTRIIDQIVEAIERNKKTLAGGKVTIKEVLTNDELLSETINELSSNSFACNKSDIFNHIEKIRGFIDDKFIEEIIKAVNNPNITPSEIMNLFLEGLTSHIVKLEERLGIITNFTEDIFTRFTTLQKIMTTSMGKNLRFAQEDLQTDTMLLDDAQNIYKIIEQNEITAEGISSDFNKFINKFDIKLETKKEHVSEINSDIGNLYTELETYKKEVDSLRTRMVRYQLESITDHLTGLYNRKYLELKIEEEIERFKRMKTPFSLMMFDLDDFKAVNDTYGHLVGDQVLKHVAHVAQKSIRKTDFIFRYGGEEFVILFFNADIRNATQITDQIRKNIETTNFSLKKKKFNITASFGVTQYIDGEFPNALLDRADDFMYEAKQSGKNCVVSEIKRA